MPHQNQSTNGRIWFGIALIIIGGLFFLSNFHFLFSGLRNIIFSWPVILLIIGILFLATHKDSFIGFVLIIVGGFGILSKFFDISFKYIFQEYWPVILIVFGLYLVFRQKGNTYKGHRGFHNSGNFTESFESYIDIFSIFSEQTKKVISKSFLGGKTTSIFSDLKIDFRECDIQGAQKSIDTLTIFGSTEFYIPNDWQIIVNVTSLFGGFNDSRGTTKQLNTENSKVLVIKGLILFGGGELKS